LLECHINEVTASWGDEYDSEEEEEEEDDDRLFETLAAVERADLHRGGEDEGWNSDDPFE
jgi:hypothetical protein